MQRGVASVLSARDQVVNPLQVLDFTHYGIDGHLVHCQAASSLLRTRSRGAHYRNDRPLLRTGTGKPDLQSAAGELGRETLRLTGFSGHFDLFLPWQALL